MYVLANHIKLIFTEWFFVLYFYTHKQKASAPETIYVTTLSAFTPQTELFFPYQMDFNWFKPSIVVKGHLICSLFYSYHNITVLFSSWFITVSGAWLLVIRKADFELGQLHPEPMQISVLNWCKLQWNNLQRLQMCQRQVDFIVLNKIRFCIIVQISSYHICMLFQSYTV